MPALAALAAALLFALLIALRPQATAERWRDWAIDHVLARSGPAASSHVAVVAIDEASLARFGPWPWPRSWLTLALTRLHAAGAKIVGVDLLLQGPDRSAPPALAEMLTDLYRRPDLARLVQDLPSPEQDLARTIQEMPVVLGFTLDDAAGGEPVRPPAPILVRGRIPALTPWTAAGGQFPLPPFAAAAAGLGALVLDGGGDGTVRSVPLLVAAGPQLLPGLALELARLDDGANAYIASDRTLQAGRYAVPLAEAAMMRFRPGTPADWQARTVALPDLLDGKVARERLAGRIVLIGITAGAVGDLRATATTPLAPSVQIQADALATLLSGDVPHRLAAAGWLEVAAGACLVLMATALVMLLPPFTGAVLTLLASVCWIAGAILALRMAGLIVDPVTPALAGLVSAAAAGMSEWSLIRQRATSLRSRFELYLAPDLVRRIVDNPRMVRLAPERRQITALFTDIADFTSLTERLDPQVLTAVLDRYFEGISEIVAAHGGMVDKFVGDAVLALFNVPLDLDDHATCAVRCALALAAFTERFRADIKADGIALGRTRIGVEYGAAVVGEVGRGQKRQFTAYGSVVNMAARLQAANKLLGTQVCVGPAARKLADGLCFRPLGSHELPGLGRVELFEPAADQPSTLA